MSFIEWITRGRVSIDKHKCKFYHTANLYECEYCKNSKLLNRDGTKYGK